MDGYLAKGRTSFLGAYVLYNLTHMNEVMIDELQYWRESGGSSG